MSHRIPLAMVLVAFVVAACQPGTGAGTTLTKVARKAPPRVAQPAASAPVAVPQASPTGTLPPAPSAAPSAPASAAPGASPTLFRPSREPDAPVPSGYVSPLPPGTFPSLAPTTLPSPNGSSTPAPTPSLLDAVVVANSLPYGEGELSGYVVEPDPAAPQTYRPVPGVTVAITYADDTAKRATLKNAVNGTFKLPEVALGAYKVRVEKSGYAADSAPTTVRIYPGYTSGHTVFLIVPAQ